MKASELFINTKHPKVSGIRHDIVDEVDHYCAIGLLTQEASKKPEWDGDHSLYDIYNLPRGDIKCPVCGAVSNNILEILAHLSNDLDNTYNRFDLIHGAHDKSFQFIGEWLKTVEGKDDA